MRAARAPARGPCPPKTPSLTPESARARLTVTSVVPKQTRPPNSHTVWALKTTGGEGRSRICVHLMAVCRCIDAAMVLPKTSLRALRPSYSWVRLCRRSPHHVMPGPTSHSHCNETPNAPLFRQTVAPKNTAGKQELLQTPRSACCRYHRT